MPMTVPCAMVAPWAMGTRENFGFFGAVTSTSLKKSRAARAKGDLFWTTNIVVSRTDLKSEDPAKMTHSISDFLRRP